MVDLKTIVLTTLLGFTTLVHSQTRILPEQALNYLTKPKTQQTTVLDGLVVSLATQNKKPKLMISEELLKEDYEKQIITKEQIKNPIIPVEYFQKWAVSPNSQTEIGNLLLKQLRLRIENLNAGIVVEESNYGLSWRLKTSVIASSDDQVARPGISLNYPFPGRGVKKRAVQKATNNRDIAKDTLSREEIRSLNKIETNYLSISRQELLERGFRYLKNYYSQLEISDENNDDNDDKNKNNKNNNLARIRESSVKSLELLLEQINTTTRNLKTSLLKESLGKSVYDIDFQTDKTLLIYKDLKINETAFLINAFNKRFNSEELMLDSLDLDVESASDSYRLKFNFSADYSKVFGSGYGNDNSPMVAYFSVSITWDSKAKKARITMAKTESASASLKVANIIDNVYNSIRKSLENFYSAKRSVELDYLSVNPLTIPDFDHYLREYGGEIDPNFFSYVKQRFEEDYVRKVNEVIGYRAALTNLKNEGVIAKKDLEKILVPETMPKVLGDKRIPLSKKREYIMINH